MIKRTYTTRMNRVRSMLCGLSAHAEQLAGYGATPEFLANLALLHEGVNRIQAQRKVIKNSAMEATAAKNRNLKAAEQLCSKARKWVRSELPQAAWQEFGFRKGEYGKNDNQGEINDGQ